MNKVKVHEFPLGIYPRRIWIAKGCNEKDIKSIFINRDSSEIQIDEEIGSEAVSTVYPNIMTKDEGKYGILIFIRRKMTVGQIAHESGHATTEIFREIGSYLDPNNQEPFMYLLGYISDCIDKVIKNKFD